MDSRKTFRKLASARFVGAVATAALALVLSAGPASATSSNYGPCDLSLTPHVSSSSIGTNHTFTARVTFKVGSSYLKALKNCAINGGTPLAGKTVRFKVLSGPNAGTLVSGVTNASGKAYWTYSSSSTGTDKVKAWFSDAACATNLTSWGNLPSSCSPFTPWVWDVAVKKWFNPYDCHSYHHH